MNKQGKVRTNAEVAAVFDEIADILELKGDNPFKIKAYRNAARVIESLTQDVSELARRGELMKIPGIGAAISKKIDEILRTGKLRLHEELKKSIPEGLLELLKIPGLGVKTVSKIHERFGISSVEELERLAREHRLRKLPGLGPKAEERILKGIEQYKRQKGVIPLWRALPLAEQLLDELKHRGFRKVAIAGDVRRMKDVVRRIDILVAGEPDAALKTFAELEGIENPSVGERSASAVISGVPVRLEVAPPEAFGAALLTLTGSEAHVNGVKTLAAEKGMKLDERGLFEGGGGVERRVCGKTEEEIYERLGLCYVPPELREGRNEVQAAAEGKLPKLIELSEVRGDLHVHTNWSDGARSVEEMALAAASLGYEYVAVCDHSKGTAGGLSEEELKRQIAEVERVNERLEQDGLPLRVLTGVEVDIKGDGQLVLGDDVLSELDVVVAAVHSKFSLDAKAMTRRIVAAMENEHVSIIAHLTGRLLGKREPYALDIESVMEKARETGTILELNAYPNRLDLNDEHCRLAKEYGVKIAISTDAHDAPQLQFMRFGVAVARRGWLEAKDVVNTLPLEELLEVI